VRVWFGLSRCSWRRSRSADERRRICGRNPRVRVGAPWHRRRCKACVLRVSPSVSASCRCAAERRSRERWVRTDIGVVREQRRVRAAHIRKRRRVRLERRRRLRGDVARACTAGLPGWERAVEGRREGHAERVAPPDGVTRVGRHPTVLEAKLVRPHW
jgi:hypothetical protein